MTQPVRVTGANYCGCPQALFTHTRTQALVWCGGGKRLKECNECDIMTRGMMWMDGMSNNPKARHFISLLESSFFCWHTGGEKGERERYVQQRETHLRRLHIKCLAPFFPPPQHNTHTGGHISVVWGSDDRLWRYGWNGDLSIAVCTNGDGKDGRKDLC